MTTATASRPGVRYRATRNSDGTFNVHGVPIFGTLPAGERGNEKAIEREWMLAAIDGAAEEERRGFLAPLKPTHASGIARASGYVRPTYVSRESYEGDEIDVLHADFIAIPPAEFDAIKRGEWPYRSVEVRSWDVPRINAVALLAADPPFFRFPMIAGVLLDESQPGAFAAMKFAAFGDEGAGEKPEASAPAASPEAEKREAGALEEIKTMLSRVVAGITALLKGGGAETDENLEAVAQPVKDAPPEAGDESDVDADETAEVAEKASADGDDGATDDSGGDDKMPNEKKDAGNMSADPVAALSALSAKMDAQTAALAAMTAERDGLAAKLAAEEAKTKAAETAAACSKAIAEARAKLRAKRRVLPADFDARAAKFYAAGTFDDFIATAEACFATDPDEHFGGGAMLAGTGDAEIDAAVAKFASNGQPGAFEAATEAANVYRAWKRTNPRSTVTIDEYLRVNVRPTTSPNAAK